MNNVLICILDFLVVVFGLLVTFRIFLIVTTIGFFDTKSPIFIQQLGVYDVLLVIISLAQVNIIDMFTLKLIKK